MRNSIVRKDSTDSISIMSSTVDKLLIINGLKAANSGIINDLPKYKSLKTLRGQQLGSAKSRQEQDADAQFLQLQMFFANENSIVRHLLDSVFKVKQGNFGSVHVVAEVLKHCVTSYEALAKDKDCTGKTPYVKPSEQHALLRVMPLAIIMLGDPNDIDGILGESDKLGKEIRIRSTYTAALKLMSLKPVVPLFGEMVHVSYHTLTLAQWFHQRPRSEVPQYIQPADMPADAAEKYNKRYELRYHLDNVRKQHAAHTLQVKAIVSDVQACNPNSAQKLDPEVMNRVYQQLSSSLQVLGQWSALVLEQTAWKCCRPRPNPDGDAGAVGEGAEVVYDRVVKFAYASDEKDALIEMIAMIKGFSSYLESQSILLSPFVSRHIHHSTQELVQNTITPMIKHTAKHKKKAVLDMLLKMREMCADWKGGVEPSDCPELVGKRNEKGPREIIQRPLAPSYAQLEMMRILVNHTCDHADETRPGFFSKAFTSNELSKDDVRDLRTWLDRSRVFDHMLDLSGSLKELSDLGNLYFREFYFSIAKSPKLPMSSSLPWILCEHMFKGNRPRLDYFEHVTAPLEIYSDAAERSLNSLRRAHLYREIEGEVIICVDQLVEMAAKKLYSHFKVMATYSLMAGTYRDFLPAASVPSASAAQAVMASRSVEILLRLGCLTTLGQTFQLSKDVSMRVQHLIRKSLLNAILRFEASGLTAAIELFCLVENTRLAHALLTEAGAEMLDFQSIMDEVNDASGMASYSSRLLRSTLAELTVDLWPNTVFHSVTGTFFRHSVTFVDVLDRSDERAELESFELQEMQDSNDRAMHLFGNKALTKALCKPKNVADDCGTVFTVKHATALIQVLGQPAVPLILQHCQQRAVELMRAEVIPYVEKIRDGVSKRIHLPSAKNYTVPGVMGFFVAELQPIASYPVLDEKVLQCFRETGNILCFASLFDQALSAMSAMSSFHLGSMLSPEAGQAAIKAMEEAKAFLGSSGAGLPAQAEYARSVIAKSGSMLKSVIGHIHSALIPHMADMMGGLGDDGIPGGALSTGEKPIEFYKVWSALVFLLCVIPKEEGGSGNLWGDHTRAEIFGHGALYTGSVMLIILRQAHRLQNFDFAEHVRKVHHAILTSQFHSAAPQFLCV